MTINGLVNSGLNSNSLFSNLSASNSSSFGTSSYGISLSDYASIKNGTYGKVLKAYYAKQSSESSTKSSSTSSDTTKTLASVEEDADSLKTSADALVANGSKSLFTKSNITTKAEDGTESTKYDYDTDKIYKGVKSFIDDYNSLIESAGDANSTSILRETLNMTKVTDGNSKMLSSVGISLNKDNTLSIDEKTFKAADMNKVKSLFNGTGSYAYNVSARASMIDYYAEREASKNNLYTTNGKYSTIDSGNGSILDSYF